MENWFAFKAYNAQTLYGFGTEDEAHCYADELNCSGNYYWPYPMTRDQIAELNLETSDLGFSLSIALSDMEETN